MDEIAEFVSNAFFITLLGGVTLLIWAALGWFGVEYFKAWKRRER